MTIKLYATKHHINGIKPDPYFIIRDNKAYPAQGHPHGESGVPLYALRGDLLVGIPGAPLPFVSDLPAYQIRKNLVYPAEGHLNGPSREPWFTMVSE